MSQKEQSSLDPTLLAGMKARSIGPAGMSGRVAAIEVVPNDHDVIYVGASTGGVWKSVNAGLTWKPIFDDQPVAAVGALAVHPVQTDIVWVGTGEGNLRNSVSIGNGIYRSLDGGRHWTHLGLEGTERIHRICLHPRDPAIAYVAAVGALWGDSEERGVYKTIDGGESWTKILYIDERTGAGELVMDPTNPDKLLVGMWDHRREPWFFRSGGPGSGLHRTHDGGKTWKRIGENEGLPKGDLGRIGIAIAASSPNVVYSFIESKKNAIYRSDDGGEKWKKVTDKGKFGNRPFYYADIHVDPQNPDRLYSLWSLVSVSHDAGKNWEILIPYSVLHPDHHAIWIDPEDPSHIWNGNDGGIGVSHDYGKTWRFVGNLPLAQFYHIAVDDETPYNIYGGMQDNGSWRGPSTVWESNGIRDHHWQEVCFGDGFDVRPDPEDAMTGYAMSQEGYMVRWNLRTGERKSIRPCHPDPDVTLRFNWNAGLGIDPFAPGTLYFGSQFIHISTDRGETWRVASPDLTSNNPEWQNQNESGGLTPDVTGAENFTTIVAIAPSAREQGLVWVGTDDGRVHVSRDGGAGWQSVEEGITGAPKNTWVPHVAPSRHDDGVAFVVLDDHRRSNFETYVYRVEQYGAVWSRIETASVDGYALSIEQDPVDPNLLFLGTEFGLYVSVDAGCSWMKWTHGVPTVSVMAMAIQTRENDLVLGTHGRAAYVVDDIAPLRGLSAETLAKPLHLFAIADAQQYRVKTSASPRFPGHGAFEGAKEPYGALITFSLNDDTLPHPDDDTEHDRVEARRGSEKPGSDAGDDAGDEKPKAKIRVADASGKVIRSFEREVKLGLNRLSWDLHRDAYRVPPIDDDFDEGDDKVGPEVLPGTYAVTVRFGTHAATEAVEVLADPRFDLSSEDRQRRDDAVLRAGELREISGRALLQIVEVRSDVEIVGRKAKEAEAERKRLAIIAGEEIPDDDESSPAAKLVKSKVELDKLLAEVEGKFWAPPGTQGYIAPTHADHSIDVSEWFLGSAWSSPTEAELAYLVEAERRLGEAVDALNRLLSTEVVSFRDAARDAGLVLFAEKERIRVAPTER